MRSFAHKKRRRYGRGLSPHNVGTAVIIVALAACAGYANLPGDAAGAAADGAGTFTGRVTRVVDGDTFWISSADERIRVLGTRCPGGRHAGWLAGDGRAHHADFRSAADLPPARHRPLGPNRRAVIPAGRA